jgi:hypothetical protein
MVEYLPCQTQSLEFKYQYFLIPLKNKTKQNKKKERE